MGVFRKAKLEYVVESLIIIAIGVLFIGWAPAVIPWMAKTLAALLVAVGAIFVIAYFFKKERGFLDSGQFAFGILVAAVGVWIFLNPTTFTDFIPKIFGVFIIASGLLNLGQTISLMRYRYGLWWLSLIFAIITIGIGAALIYKASEANELIVRLIGASLTYDGLSNLWTASRISKNVKAYEEAKEAVIQAAEAVDTEGVIVESEDGSEEKK